jgi:hypothetical protein
MFFTNLGLASRTAMYVELPQSMNEVYLGDCNAWFQLGMHFLRVKIIDEAYHCFYAGAPGKDSDHNAMLMLADMHCTGCGALYDQDGILVH